MNQELTITDDEINFDTIKRWKKEFGVKSIEDLIVLARVNDPFYVGEKSKRILLNVLKHPMI
jgi:hypothetical protein